MVKLKQLLQNNLWFGENGLRPASLFFLPREAQSAVITPPTADKVWGIDISHWNIPPVNIKRMRDLFGMSFVIIKACDGSLNSRYVDEHVTAAKNAGLPFGLYCWLYPDNRVSIAAQTDAWAAAYNKHKPTIGVAIDAETTYYGGQLANPLTADLQKAATLLAQKIGAQNVVIYTSPGYAKANLNGFNFSQYRLWIANYGVSVPALPALANGYEFWQYTSNLDGLLLDPNGNKSLDGNLFNGTLEQFRNKYSGGVNVPPQTGGTMKQGTLTQGTTSLRIRSGPGATYPQIGGILPGDTVFGELDAATNWLHIQWIIRAGGVRENIDGWCSASYLVLSDYVPPANYEEIKITIQREGWKDAVVIVRQERL